MAKTRSSKRAVPLHFRRVKDGVDLYLAQRTKGRGSYLFHLSKDDFERHFAVELAPGEIERYRIHLEPAPLRSPRRKPK